MGHTDAWGYAIAERLDKGEHFQEADFDAVVRRIAARERTRWANL